MPPRTVKWTIRGLEAEAHRRLKARAAREGRSMGQVLSTMIYQAEPPGNASAKRGSIADLKPEPWGKGTEHDSERVDEIVYGVPPRGAEASGGPRTFKRPPPRRGRFVDDPLEIIELAPRRKGRRARAKASKR